MNIKDTSQIRESLNTLIRLSRKNNIINEVEYSGYIKLSKDEPLIMFGLLCQKIYALGAAKLFKNHGDIMQTLNVCYPSFSKFIGRVTLSKKADFGTRNGELFPIQVTELIKNAFNEKLINEDEKNMYDDLIGFDASIAIDIEIDILMKVYGWEYSKLKKEAPSICDYIKKNYPEYYEGMIKPHVDAIKKSVL